MSELQQPESNTEVSQTVSAQTPSQIAAALQREHADWVSEITTAPGYEFNFLADLCGFDRGPEEEPRFEVNYHLFSTTKYHRLRLKVLLNEDDVHVPSVTCVWRTANW